MFFVFFSSSGLIGFFKRISGWNLQLISYILSLWMQNYSCPDKKRWIGRWSMRTMVKDEAQGEAQEAEAMGRSTSFTCLGMKLECLKSAPSPLSFLDTVVKSNLAIGSFLFYISFLGIWLISGFWFFNCFVQRSTCKRPGQLWNPLWKSLAFHVNLIW